MRVAWESFEQCESEYLGGGFSGRRNGKGEEVLRFIAAAT